MKRKTVLQLEGYANDLLTIENEHNFKQTRLVVLDDKNPETDETIDIAITSVDPTRNHPFFNNEIENKRIGITVEVFEE